MIRKNIYYQWYKFIPVIICLLLHACIVEYEPKDIKTVSGALVVDGTITDGQTVITLTRGVGLSEKYDSTSYVNNAIVYVECDNGNRFEAGNTHSGRYIIETGELASSCKYRLCISVDNEKYESEYLSPLITPPIDSLSCMKKGEGEPVFICVSTHDSENRSEYYRWEYKEHWEIKSEMFSQARFYKDNPDLYLYHLNDLHSPNNTYYCWGKDSSKVYIVDSSTKLTDNIISQKKLIEMEPSHDKLSVLYYIWVSQKQIRKEAFDYYKNMQKNIEQTGSVFSPMPSEIRGNIKCISHPDKLVVGYVEVSTTTTKERFIEPSEGYFEPPVNTCSKTYGEGRPVVWENYAIYSFVQGQGTGPDGTVPGKVASYAARRCLDCRLRGTKEKPSFWPTAHL